MYLCNVSLKMVYYNLYTFFWEINDFVQQGCIKLIKSNGKDIASKYLISNKLEFYILQRNLKKNISQFSQEYEAALLFST